MGESEQLHIRSLISVVFSTLQYVLCSNGFILYHCFFSMKRKTQEELEDAALRSHYQAELGKALRLSQWIELKLEIQGGLPTATPEKMKEILTSVAKYKKLSRYWKVNATDVEKISRISSIVPINGMFGADLHSKMREIASYEVSDVTIKQWFREVAKTYSLSKRYSSFESIQLLTKALVSQPRKL